MSWKRSCPPHVTWLYVLSFILCIHIHHVTGQSSPTPPTIQDDPVHSQVEKDTVLLLHNLMKSNPKLEHTLEKLIQAAKQIPDNSSIGGNDTTTFSPGMDLTKTLLSNIIKSMGRRNSSTSGLGALAGIGDVMKNPLVKSIVEITMEELERARVKASATNGTNTTTSLGGVLGMLSPVTILRRVLASTSARQLMPRASYSHVTDQCFNDVVDTLDAVVARNRTEQKMWAISMFDATGKLEGGVMKGRFYFIGSYDQCIATGKVAQTQGREFGARYCRADIKIEKSLIEKLNVNTRGLQLKLTWGLCVPDSCHRRDVTTFLRTGNYLPIKSVYCYEDKNIGEDGSAVAAIVILSIFAALVVLATVYDVVRNSLPTQTANQVELKPIANGSIADKYTVTPTVMITNDKHVNYSAINEGFQDYMPHKEDVDKASYDVSTPMTSTEVMVSTTTGQPDTTMEVGNEAPKPRKESIVGRMLKSFSLYTNIPKILQAKSTSGSVSCIHGIRFFSMTWVVLGHTYNYGIISTSETFNTANLLDFVSVMQRFSYQAVIGGGFSVDTFFVLSAFLMTWLQLKETDKKKNKLTVRDAVMFYFHRFWRLTPIYMIVIMAWGCLYSYLGDGPMWPGSIGSAEACKTNWWTNLLYVNNLVNTDEECLGHSWYLANDMQFYWISPIFLIAMYMFPAVGALLTVLLLGVGVGTTLWKEYVYHGNFFTMKSDGGQYWHNVYTVPWCRVGCWAVGMILGFIVYKRGRRQFKNKIVLAVGWLLAAAVAITIVYIPYTENQEGGTPWTPIQRAFYEGLGRPAWGACIAWVIFACFYGGGGIVNSFLSWNGFIPLSRLTYSAYLVHPMCMMVNIFSRRTLLYISDYSIMYLFLGHLCVTYMVAFVCSLAFEAPFMTLEKVLFRRGAH